MTGRIDGIQGGVVAGLFPPRGPVHVILVGEAPGPRGADRSGIPFWGDRAGRPLYQALVQAAMARVPDAAWASWEGERLRALKLRPVLSGAALTNAYSACPTDDGHRFRAPRPGELQAPTNLRRLRSELERAGKRCPGPLRVIAVGAHARKVLTPLLPRWLGGRALLSWVPHPSAQGLLSSVPGRGRGLRLAALEADWVAAVVRLLGGVPSVGGR